MGLSKKEIDQLIYKLREKYKVSNVEYNTRLFNLDAFEDRFRMALQKRMNLEAFILAEIANYEKIKQNLAQEREIKDSYANSFSEQVDRIIQENTARISKYNAILFHRLAGPEISRFYGALSEFTNFYFSILRIVISEYEHKEMLYGFEDRLAEFSAPMGKKHAKRIEDHILILTRPDSKEIEIEKDKNNYLKESAFLLHEIIGFLDGLMSIRNKDWEIPLRFDKLYVEGEKKKRMLSVFSGMTPYGAILKVKDQAEQIVEDFRLGSFKRRS